MPVDDAVLFLADARNNLRLVFAHLGYFLPRLDEPLLLRLADRFSPSRPSVASLLTACVNQRGVLDYGVI